MSDDEKIPEIAAPRSGGPAIIKAGMKIPENGIVSSEPKERRDLQCDERVVNL